MKYIPLKGGAKTLVDDDDYDYYIQWKWLQTRDGYVYRYGWDKSQKKTVAIFLHRQINDTPKGMETDHINRDKLDNRKSNLRTVTTQQNRYNIGMYKNNTSGHVGIVKQRKRWRARIGGHSGNHLGMFDTLEEAIEARNEALKKFLP